MIHNKFEKRSITKLKILDVFRTSILQLSHYKNNFSSEKFRYMLVNDFLKNKSHCEWSIFNTKVRHIF